MLVCLSFFFVVSDDCDDNNNDGVQRKSQGRGMSACVIIFPGVSTRGS